MNSTKTIKNALNSFFIDAIDGLLRRTLGEHIDIEIVGRAELWPALVDPA